MANQPTISVDTRAPTKKGGRLKEISGRLALSAGGSFGTSNMERFFRQKMTALNITLPSGKLAQYHPGVNHLSGTIQLYGVSNISTNYDSVSGFPLVSAAGGSVITSGTFMATGF